MRREEGVQGRGEGGGGGGGGGGEDVLFGVQLPEELHVEKSITAVKQHREREHIGDGQLGHDCYVLQCMFPRLQLLTIGP